MSSKVLIQDGIKFVYLSESTPFKIGYAHGTLLKDEIKDLINQVKLLSSEKLGKTLGSVIFKTLVKKAKKFEGRFSPGQIEEIRGISKGSNQEYKYILAANTIYEAAVSLGEIITGCSCFIAPWKDSNKVIVGKTTDLLEPIQLTQILTSHRVLFVYNHPNFKAPALVPSFSGCLSGDAAILENKTAFFLNDGGLFHKKLFPENSPITVISRNLMESCTLVGDLKDKIIKSKTIKPVVFLITDGSKANSYLIEKASQDSYVKSWEENGLLNTNFLSSVKLRRKYYKGRFCNLERLDAKSHNVTLRFQKIKPEMENISNTQQAIDILKMHAENFGVYEGSISNITTAQGLVYLPSEDKIFFPSGEKVPVTYWGKWKEFSIREIFEKLN